VLESITFLARFAYSFVDFKIEKINLSRRNVILSSLSKFPYFSTGARGTEFFVVPTFFKFRFSYKVFTFFVLSIKFLYLLFHFFFLYISCSCWYSHTTCARSTELPHPPPPFSNFLFTYLFSIKINYYFISFFLF
jgi:hypothetical protein